MTSATSRADVEDALYVAGIRDPRHVTRLMLVIDRFAVDQAHHYLHDAPEDPGIPVDPYYLLPGEYDLKAGVTMCRECAQVKPWVKNFHVDRAHPTGRLTICRACIRDNPAKNDERYVPSKRYRQRKELEKGYLCRRCGGRKELDQFPRAKQLRPAIVAWCLECQPGAEQEKTDSPAILLYD